MEKNLFLALLFLLTFTSCESRKAFIISLSDYGIYPDSGENISGKMVDALAKIYDLASDANSVVLRLDSGRYDLYPESAFERTYYISNHDQVNPKRVGIALENWKNLVFDGEGAELVFHGRMLPISLLHSTNCTLKNLSIDFETPHICQVTVLENDPESETITFQPAPWVNYSIKDGVFYHSGEDWEMELQGAFTFEKESRRVVYRAGDVGINIRNVEEIKPGVIMANNWKDERLVPGTVLAMRSWQRPAPGIFLYGNRNSRIENITVHYAEGMGLLAQCCEDITLDHFSVALKGEDDPRYFTTQADATHFSGCRGKIISKNGLYEAMLDDAINVHGTYLKVIERLNDTTLLARYMHGQSYGFEWGNVGDEVSFVYSTTMEIEGEPNKIEAITAEDKEIDDGVKIFKIVFEKPLDTRIDAIRPYGIENLEWTPEVVFSNNIVRNNRARGALFSTPCKTLIEGNLFDHTSGTAILLCGDCNGWYETGACRDVTIRNNKFINALTCMYQFTNAVISIYPEIPDLSSQQKYFHGGIVIENNLFETFDRPLVYAKSVDGLQFRGNTIITNQDYPAFHRNEYPFFFQRVINYNIEDNEFDDEVPLEQKIRVE